MRYLLWSFLILSQAASAADTSIPPGGAGGEWPPDTRTKKKGSEAKAADASPETKSEKSSESKSEKTPAAKTEKDGKEQKEADWPPMEVNPAPEDPKAIYPTEGEIEKIKQLCVEGKNSGDSKKFAEAEELGRQIEKRMCNGSNLTVEEWGKRFDEMNKLAAEFKKARGINALGTYQLCDAMVEDFAKTEGHAAFFAKLKWMQSRTVNLKFDARKIRIATYKYIENHAEKFKDNAAKQLFCDQLMKGGVNDPGIKELRDSYK